MSSETEPRKDEQLLQAIKANLPELKKLLEEYSSHWGYEDPIYRFYHHSYKVVWLQDHTTKIVESLKKLMPDLPLNEQFMEIYKSGTGKAFSPAWNKDWDTHTRPIVEVFFHAKYFLEMAIKYGEELETAVNTLPSGWASVLYLYGLR